MISIRRHLLKTILLALALGALATSTLLYFRAKEEIDELYEQNMRDHAFMLRATLPLLTSGQVRAPQQAAGKTRLSSEQDFLIQAWDGSGRLVYTSHPAIGFPAQTGKNFSNVDFDGAHWTAFTLYEPFGIVQVAQPNAARRGIVREMFVNLLLPLLAQLLIVGVLIWLGVLRGLKPLGQISKALSLRTAHSLDPLSEMGIPTEIHPLVRALNALFARLDTALSLQRRFNADAAHELRTPLAALRLQIDNLKRATNPVEQAETTQRLESGIVRTAHLVDQLLTMAKLEPDVVEFAFQPIDLPQLLRECMEAHQQLAESRQIALRTERLDTASIRGDAFGLNILINNLLDNAIRYTPKGGTVNLSIHQTEQGCNLIVQDTGIGIPEDQQSHIFKRFHRIQDGTTLGTGLGLAIAEAIAEQHGTRIQLQSESGGGSVFSVRLFNAASPRTSS